MTTKAVTRPIALSAPSAWRGSSRKEQDVSLPSALMKEISQHPLQTLAFVAAGIAMARLAFAPRQRQRISG